MDIGIRLHDVAPGTLEERLHTAHEQGFKCAHIALSKVCDYKMTLPELTPGWATYIKHAFDKEQMDAAVLGCYLNLATPDEAALKLTQEKYKAHIRFNSMLGASVVGTETGAPNTEYKFTDECHTEAAYNAFIKGFKPVVEYAEKMGVIVAIEPVFKHIIWNPKMARRALDDISSPNLQIIFDPVNMLHVSNYQQRDEIFEEAMDLLKNEIAVIHIKDFVVEGDELKSIAAGTGEMDYSKIVKFAKECKPHIQATLEDTKPDNAVAARQCIQKLWDEA